MTSLRTISLACAETDARYVSATCAEHWHGEFVVCTHDGDRVSAVFDLGRLPPKEIVCFLERATRIAQKAISLHAVVKP